MLNLVFMLIAVAGAGLSIYFAFKTPSPSHQPQERTNKKMTVAEPEILSEITIRIIRGPDDQKTLDVTCSGGEPLYYLGLLEQVKQSIRESAFGEADS